MAPEYRPARLATLYQELRCLQERHQEVEADPSLDVDRSAIEVRYYDAVIQWLQERVACHEADLRCAGLHPDRYSDGHPPALRGAPRTAEPRP